MKSELIKAKSQLVNTTKDVSLKTNKRVFVNHDGTIAEDINTYRQFKSDLSNRSYGF